MRSNLGNQTTGIAAKLPLAEDLSISIVQAMAVSECKAVSRMQGRILFATIRAILFDAFRTKNGLPHGSRIGLSVRLLAASNVDIRVRLLGL